MDVDIRYVRINKISIIDKAKIKLFVFSKFDVTNAFKFIGSRRHLKMDLICIHTCIPSRNVTYMK